MGRSRRATWRSRPVMLEGSRTAQARACARRLAGLTTTGIPALPNAIEVIELRAAVDRSALDDAFRRAHPFVRVQAVDALVEAKGATEGRAGYVVDRGLLAAIHLVLTTIAPYVIAERVRPALYVTPPDLIAVLDEDVDELARLLVELVGAATERQTIVTVFFSEVALRELCLPLQRPGNWVTLTLYVSLRRDERARLSPSSRALPERSAVIYHVRSADESAMPHAKLILRDGVDGYLGSANISLHGLHEQFERDVRLDEPDVRTSETILDTLVHRGLYTRWSPD